MATSPTVNPTVAKSIQSQIANIQSGINSLRSGSSGGSSSPSSSSGAGAVNAQGQIVSGGRVVGTANAADRYSPGARPAAVSEMEEGLAPIGPTEKIEQLDPNAEAPQSMINQASQLQSQVSNLAQSKGLKLQQTASGGYTSVPDLASQYRQGFTTAQQSAQQSGQLSPQTQGAGSAIVGSVMKNLSPQQESPSILGPIQNSDSMFDSLFTQFDDYFSPVSQKSSLVDEYKKLSKSLGLEDINAELIDAKRIIEGTEDDIRNEITAAGGTATDSQVMAMANARNKSLIKNYNTLLDTKNAATTQLTTLMELSVQDRQFAEAEFDRKMNFAFQVANFQQKATENAKSTYLSLIENGLGSSLLTNPNDARLVEKTLGLPSGGLTQVIQAKEQERALQLKKSNLEIKGLESNLLTDQMQRSNIQSQINERNSLAGGASGIVPGAKPTGKPDFTSAGYATRTTTSHKTINDLGEKFVSGSSLFGKYSPNVLKSEQRQQYDQAQQDFLTAVLRKESGASISPEETKNGKEQYFPQPGDKPGVIFQKEVNRVNAINGLIGSSGTAYSGSFLPTPTPVKNPLNGDLIILTD